MLWIRREIRCRMDILGDAHEIHKAAVPMKVSPLPTTGGQGMKITYL